MIRQKFLSAFTLVLLSFSLLSPCWAESGSGGAGGHIGTNNAQGNLQDAAGGLEQAEGGGIVQEHDTATANDNSNILAAKGRKYNYIVPKD